jgi:outer membrane lipoprotein SlyB
MNMIIKKISLFSLTLVLLSCWITASQAAKKGANITIRHGVVESSKQVQFQSSAAGGALVGGIVGYNMNTDKSSSKQRRRTLGGAALGGAMRRSAEGDLSGMEYTVKITDGSVVKIVTDQTQIHQGDCVAVEQAGESANIRRVDNTMCEKESESAIKQIEQEIKEEAQECLDAKQQMLNAETEEQMDIATRKIKMLCNN